MSLRIFCRLSWVFVLCACSESLQLDDPEQHAPGELTAESNYIGRRVEAEESRAERCCEEDGANGIVDGYWDALMRGLEMSLPMEGSGARYDPQAAGACIAAVEASTCRSIKNLRRDDALAACARIYSRGMRELGQSCKQTFDCAESAEGETTCGIAEVRTDGFLNECKLLVRVGEGDGCVSGDPRVDIECELPLLCDDVRGRCVAPAERGQPCITGPEWGDTCAQGSVCDRTITKRCVEPIAVGDACEDGELCEGLACGGGACRTPTEYSGLCTW